MKLARWLATALLVAHCGCAHPAAEDAADASPEAAPPIPGFDVSTQPWVNRTEGVTRPDATAPRDAGKDAKGPKYGSSIYVPPPTGLPPTGAAGGDLSGTFPNPTVAKANGASVPAAGALVTGNVLQATGAAALTYAPLNLAGGTNFVTGSLPSANQVAQTMGGDVTGTTAAAVVAKVNGTTVPGGGALTTGNACYVSGAAACTYSALNLAGGATFVTGLLPTGNQAAQTLTGDATGNTGATIVSKINGTTVATAGGALTTGQVLRATGVATVDYGAVNLANSSAVTGVLPVGNQANQSLAGDVTGNTGAAVVSAISGTSPIAITPASLQWTSTTVAPTLTQASESTVTKGADLTIAPQQSTHTTDQGGGNIAMNFEAPTGAGVEAGPVASRAGSAYWTVQQLPGLAGYWGLWLGTPAAALSTTNSLFYVDGTNTLLRTQLNTGLFYFYGAGTSYGYISRTAIAPAVDNMSSVGLTGTRWSDVEAYTASFAGAISGGNNLPLQLKATSGALSTAANITLSNAQIQTPLIQLNGTTQAAETLTVPNTVGGSWCFDFTGVTLGANTVTIGTGSGTQPAIGATSLVGALKSICCHVYASNFVSCGGG